MSLAATLNVAQSALATNAALSSIVSRNIAGVNDPNYSRKTGELSTGPTGAGTLTGTSRATDLALFANLISANADAASGQALADGLDQLEQTVNLTGTGTGDNAPASAIATLTNALQSYAASPSDAASAQAVLTSAKALASNLNAASASVQNVRSQADKAMAASVSTINSLLDQFSGINTTIIKGTVSGADVTDALDARDKLLKSLSQEIGISTVPAPNGGMAIYTDSGATLFQGAPRAVAFTPTATFTAGTSGGVVSVDGVPVTGPNAVMAIRSGKLAGLVQLRDVATVNYQNQLDQIAGGLITAFADSDQTGGSAPTVPGLFTYSGAPSMPAPGQAGLAASIAVNPAVDPSQGGTITLLRDGGIGGGGNPAYTANTTAGASYSGYITGLLGKLDTRQNFDAASGGAAHGTLAEFASSSVSWLEASRQSATNTADSRNAVVTQTTAALSSATGVNLDEQMSRMLDLEHSYQASAELITTVKTMLDSLLAAIQ